MNLLLKWFPTLAPLYRHVSSASPRERVFLELAAYLITGIVLYYAVLAPSLAYRSDMLRAQSAASNGLAWMQANQEKAKLRTQGKRSSAQSENRLSMISSSADMHNVSIKRLQPSNDRIDIELAGQEYLSLIRWLVSLENDQGFVLIDARLDKVAEGVVDSRIALR